MRGTHGPWPQFSPGYGLGSILDFSGFLKNTRFLDIMTPYLQKSTLGMPKCGQETPSGMVSWVFWAINHVLTPSWLVWVVHFWSSGIPPKMGYIKNDKSDHKWSKIDDWRWTVGYFYAQGHQVSMLEQKNRKKIILAKILRGYVVPGVKKFSPIFKIPIAFN